MRQPEPPVTPLRMAGHARLSDGADLAWSVAEGRRGSRWRETVTRLGRLLETRLIEVDREGRFERLEAATAAGMITLHPSPDGRRLHGNVVSAGGVRHLTLGWGPAHRLLVSGSPASVAVVCHDLDAQVPPGTTTQFRGVAVDAELRLIEGSLRIERTGYRDWRVSAPTTAVVAETELDERGLPAGLGVWPLEEPAPD